MKVYGKSILAVGAYLIVEKELTLSGVQLFVEMFRYSSAQRWSSCTCTCLGFSPDWTLVCSLTDESLKGDRSRRK